MRTSLLSKLDDLRTACASLTPTNDNRNAIRTLYDGLGDEINGLAVVSESESIGAAYSAAHNRYVVTVSALQRKLRYIASTEEGTKLPQRRMRQALLDLRRAANAFTEDNDTRPAAVKAIGTLRTNLGEVTMLDLGLDRWYVDAVHNDCEALLKIMEQPIEPAADSEALERVPDARRLKAKDASDDLLTRVRSIGFRYFASFAEASPTVVKVEALRQQISATLFAPLNDTAAMAAEVRAIKAEVSRLMNVRIPEGGNAQLLRESIQAAQNSADALLAILDPHAPSFTASDPASSWTDRVRNMLTSTPFAFGE